MTCCNETKVLYEFASISGPSFFEECISNDEQALSHKLEYFIYFNGENDVIRYTNCNNKKIVSYYTIRDGRVLCGFVRDGEIEWFPVDGMLNFVILRFEAFKDIGITFVTEEINNLCKEKINTRIKNR